MCDLKILILKVSHNRSLVIGRVVMVLVFLAIAKILKLSSIYICHRIMLDMYYVRFSVCSLFLFYAQH